MIADFHTPDWVKNAVFYQIFPDRFAKSEALEKPDNLEPWDTDPSVFGFKGGDLLGVAERLDYLVDLGISAIYFNPIFQSTANHRYHTHDYFQIDPILGGDVAFQALLDQAHDRGIRIVLDGVFNHASRGFFQFNHILENGPESPYIDWFTIRKFPLNAYQGEPQYRAWADLPALPEFNTLNPQVREFIFEVARYWLERGMDGWRLDVPFEIDDDGFWQEFRQVAKEVNPQAYLVGEIPWEARRWLQGDQFDAVMNYQFTQACLAFFSGKGIDWEVAEGMMGLPHQDAMDAASFLNRMQYLLEIYPPQAALAQFNLLSSHDMPRFLAMVGGDQSALRLATLFQMTYPGAPSIYYGDEIGLSGGKRNYSEASRQSFPWDESRWDKPLLAYFRQVIAIRNEHPALRTGQFLPLYGQGRSIAYLRRDESEALLCVINAGDQPFDLEIPLAEILPEGSNWRDLLGAGQARLQEGSFTGDSLPPRTARIYGIET